jgi:putative ubiquitin-RnfH superfamily antitoxin RatB of RatAB toxin-antitoxin module
MLSVGVLETAMANVKTITIEVAYAHPNKQAILKISVPENTTVESAIRASGILEQFPEIDLDKNGIGIFGKITTLDAPLCSQDRIEIYCPLVADPKQTRRERAAKTQQVSKHVL